MAGSNQAINLGGMMNQIAGTIGEGYTINGKNAGAALGDTLANLAKPSVENGTAEEYQALADWASRNGREQEFAVASEQARQAQKDQNAMAAMVGIGQIGQRADTAAQQGDRAGIQQQIKELTTQMAQYQKDGNPEGFKAAQQEIQRIRGMVPQAIEVETDNKASGIVNFRKMLKDGQRTVPAPTKENPNATQVIPLSEADTAAIQQQLATLESDPNAVRKANAQLLQQHQADVAAKAAETDVKVDALQDGLKKAATEDDLDLLLAGIEDADVRAAMLPAIDAQRKVLQRAEERESKRLMLETRVVTEDDINNMESMIAELGGPDDPVSIRANKLLETYKNLDDMSRTAGVYHDVGSRERAAAAAQKAEQFIVDEWSKRQEQARRDAVADDNNKKQILLEARGATLVAPSEQDISQYQLRNESSRAEAIDALSTQAEENYFNLLMEYDPETAQKTLQDGLTIDKLVTKMGNGTSPAKVEAVLRDYYGYAPEQAEAITEAAVLRADRAAQKDSDGFFSSSFKDNGQATGLWRKFINHMTTLPEERGQ